MTLLCLAETANPDGLQGEARKLIDMLIQHAGGDPAEVIHRGVKPTTRIKEAKDSYPTYQALLEELQPDKVLALGGTAATVVLRAPRKVPITKTRGRGEWVEYGDGQRLFMVSSVSPSLVLRRAGNAEGLSAAGAREWFRDLYRDVTKWVQEDEPLPLPDLEDATTVVSTPEALEYALSLLEPYEAVSCDLETEPDEETLADLRAREHDHEKAACPGCKAWSSDFPTAGLDPLRARIMTVGLGTVSGPQILFHRDLLEQPGVGEMLYSFLWERDEVRTIFHNAKFDLSFLALAIGHPAAASGGDTQLLSWLLDERPVRSQYKTHGLKDISRYRYDIPDYHFDWARFWATPDDERDWAALHYYHALDIHQTARLWYDLLDEAAEQPGLMDVHDNLLWPASLALAEAELRGINVDREYLVEYRRRLDRRLERRLAALRSALGDPEFNPGSGKEVEALVFDDDPGWGMEPVAYSGFKTTLGSTGQAFVKRNSRKEQLEKLAQEQADRRQARILRMIVDYRHDLKARETYAEGLLRASDVDGRVHTSFNLAGAVTGRLSSSDPNLQNIPKRGPTADAIRRAFVPPPGWVLMDADYSQLELRVAALLSRDERFAGVYREGRDIHSEVAGVMFHKDPSTLTYMERYLAKAVDFGALYGRSGKAISMGAEMEYYEKKMGGTKWTAAEAQAFVDRFLDGFPNLRKWMTETAQAGLTERELQTPFGRKRRFPLILREDQGAVKRQSFNTPIQSVASDICLSAFIRLSQILDPDQAKVLVTIHDSIMLEVREDAVHEVAAIVKEAMMDVPPVIAELNADLGIPFAADVKVGSDWTDGAMHDLEPEGTGAN
jgi:DNA polymerase I-like protein with 3'-5' exonuclease and polymerase domains